MLGGDIMFLFMFLFSYCATLVIDLYYEVIYEHLAWLEAPYELFVKFVQDACIASLIVTLPLQLPKIEALNYFSSW